MVHYWPTQPENVLQHSLRKRIIELLQRTPPSTAKALQEELACSRGTVNHHLRILERCGHIKIIRACHQRMFFLPSLDAGQATALAMLRSGRTLEVLMNIRNRPGIAHGGLTQDLEVSRKMMRIYIDRLVATGLVRNEKAAKGFEYYPTRNVELVLKHLADAKGMNETPILPLDA